jgi:integrase
MCTNPPTLQGHHAGRRPAVTTTPGKLRRPGTPGAPALRSTNGGGRTGRRFSLSALVGDLHGNATPLIPPIPPTAAARIARSSDQLLVVTAAYTGMRWGELAGLARANTHLDDGLLVVHPEVGALHEVGAHLYLGPPKTADSAREIHLPPFLVARLRALLDSHDHDLVFTGSRGGLLRRSAMSRRVFAPAVNGAILGFEPVTSSVSKIFRSCADQHKHGRVAGEDLTPRLPRIGA